MKPFNLEAALAGAPVIQRAGRPARIIGIAPELGEDSSNYILGVEQERNGAWEHTGWYKSGMHMYKNSPTECDLFMAPTKKTLYCVMYYDPTVRVCLRSFACLGDRDEWLTKRRKLYSNNKIIELFEKEYEE